jgi:6-methylsalicylate decarboxylase
MTMIRGGRSVLSTVPAACGCALPRRRFLGQAAVLGAAALAPFDSFTQSAQPHRIDIHHHILPPAYMQAIAARRGGPVPDWSAARSLEEMDKTGIATSMLSIVQPGVWLGNDEEGRRLARECNDFGARMVRDQPRRFGLFAALPLGDVQGSLLELTYAFDTLKADGIGLMTSFGDKWLGDPAFWPVLEELNRRKAVVYTHPTQPNCCRNLVTDVTSSTIEWTTDTTRTIASLVFTGTAAKFPDIRWIFSHGGGTAPFLIGRFQTQEANMKDRNRRFPQGVMHEIRKFYYDTAQANHAGALAALLAIVPSSQVLLGTDYPFRKPADEIGAVGAYKFSATELRAIERDNALKLLPRIAG